MKRTFTFSTIRMVFSWYLMLITHQSFASNLGIECPAQIPIEHIQIGGSTEAWIPQIRSPMPLTGAGFMQAPPEKMAYLKPTSTKDQKNSTTVIWKFEGDYPLGKWLTCDYANGAVSMSKEIDKTVTECAVTYEKKNKNRLITVNCK